MLTGVLGAFNVKRCAIRVMFFLLVCARPANTSTAHIIAIYRQRAKEYDADPMSSLNTWRKEAVKLLNLKYGDLVVDIGCGTGLNFPLLQEVVGPQGRIIGVDLTDAMLDQARQRVAAHGWKNVELVQSDAAKYEFPIQVHGIISTFALTFVPNCGYVIQSGCKVLAPGRRWVVLDMA
jgi:ubiquinone/menaquinone biosynthesis C-methylase UbiE